MLAAIVGVILAVLAVVRAPAPACRLGRRRCRSSRTPPRVLADPSGTLATFRALGVSMVRVIVGVVADRPGLGRPHAADRNFDAADPAAYPAANWAPYDAIVKIAAADGIAVDFTLSGGAPRWAEGPGIPPAALDNPYWAWRPSAHRVRPVRPGGGRALQRNLRAAGSGRPAAPGQLLGDLERAELRRGPGAAGGQWLHRVGRRRACTATWWDGRGARCRRPATARDTILIGEFAPRGLSAARDPQAPAGAPRDVRPDKAAPVPAHAVLRGLRDTVPLRRGRPRVVGCPTTRGRVTRVPAEQPGPVRRDRPGRPSLPARPAARDRDQRATPTSRRFRDCRTSSARSTASSACTGHPGSSRSTTPSTATSPTPPTAARSCRRRPPPSTSTGRST